MTILEDITGHVSKAARIPEQEVDAKTRIYDSGIISSLKLIELMSYIEKRYGFEIRPEELVEENFGDVGAIVDFIRSKVPDRNE
jgi:acyl carrier protein